MPNQEERDCPPGSRVLVDGVVETINAEGRVWRTSQPAFPRSSVRNVLSQTHTYASQLIQCGHCGHPITGETITKKTKNGERYYTYYRCTYYNRKDHPRIRVREADLEQQVLAVFDKMKVENEDVRDWLRLVLASQTRDAQAESLSQRGELQRQETLLVQQQDRLLNMRLSEDIDQETFARKHTELRDGLASIKLQLGVVDRCHDETAELAAKVFELSRSTT